MAIPFRWAIFNKSHSFTCRLGTNTVCNSNGFNILISRLAKKWSNRADKLCERKRRAGFIIMYYIIFIPLVIQELVLASSPAIEFETRLHRPTFQVELLRRRLRLAQIQGGSLPFTNF